MPVVGVEADQGKTGRPDPARPRRPLARGGSRARPLPPLLVAGVLLLTGCGGKGFLSDDPPGCRETVVPEGGVQAATTWILAPDTADRALLDAWCVAVGPAVHLPLPEDTTDTGDGTPAHAAAEAGDPLLGADSVAVLTWNLGIGGGALVRLVEDLRAGRLTGGEPIHHFVLLLQEAYRAGSEVPPAETLPEEAESGSHRRPAPPGAERRDVVALARELGLSLYYVPSMRNGIEAVGDVPEDRGNAVLSTFPMDAFHAIELPHEIQRRVSAQVRLSGRTVAGRPWSLVAVSAHLDNASLTRPFASLGSLRGSQSRWLVASLPAGVPLVVGGDFNTWWGQTEEEAARVMRQAFPWPEEWEGRATATRMGRERILDYLFFRGPAGWSFEDRWIGDRYGSDHNPLLGWVRIPPEP